MGTCGEGLWVWKVGIENFSEGRGGFYVDFFEGGAADRVRAAVLYE